MERSKYIILIIIVVAFAGSLFAYSSYSNAKEGSPKKENQALLVDKKVEIVNPDNYSDDGEIVYKELVNSNIENNINLNLRIEDNLDGIEKIADIEIEKQNDMEMIKTVYRNIETGKSIFVAQSINELGDTEKYLYEIKNKWYEGEELAEIVVNGYSAIVREGEDDTIGLYVVTNDFVYTFIGDKLELLLRMAENTPFK